MTWWTGVISIDTYTVSEKQDLSIFIDSLLILNEFALKATALTGFV